MKRPSIRRQFLVNVGGETYSQLVTIGTQLLVLPIMLALWGPERYGTWLVLSAFPTYLLLADLGLSQVMGNEMTMRLAAGDRQGVRVATQTAWKMTLWVVIVATSLIALGLAFSPLATAFPKYATPLEVQVTVGALAGSSLLWVALGNLSAAMRAAGSYGVMVFINANTRILDAALTIGAAALGGGFVGAAVSILAARIVVGTVISTVFYAKNPLFRPGLQLADRALLLRMLRPSLAYLAMVLSNLLNLQGAIMIVGFLLGPSAVVVVSAIRTLTRVGRMFSSAVTNAIEPIFAQLAGSGVREKGHLLYRRLVIGTALGVAAYVIGMLVVGEAFLAWWTHGNVVGHHWLFYLLIAASVFEIVWMTLQVPIAATNRYSEFTGWFSIISIAGAVALYLTTPRLDVLAAGLVPVTVHAAMIVVVLLRMRGGKVITTANTTLPEPAP